MITDIKGFTAHTSEQTREGLTDYIRRHENLLLPVFKYFKGTVVKNLGDAFLVTFESPTDAVLCGMTVQEVLRQHNAFAEEKEKLAVRVAVNAGEVELKGGDIFGEAVNITSRLEGVAEAGEVYFTEAVYQTMNRKEAPSSAVGEKTFKGIPFPIRVYKVIHDPQSDVHGRLSNAVRLTEKGPVIKGLTTADKGGGNRKAAAIVILVILLAGIGAGAFFILKNNPDKKILQQADQLIAKGEHRAALELIDRSLAQARDPLVMHGRASKAAAAHLDELLSGRSKQEALTWLRNIVKEKPYLEKLSSRIPALETEVTVRHLIRSGTHQHTVWKGIRDLLAKYPKDPDVPYIAATILQEKYIVGVTVWLFKKAIERGKYQNDENIFRSCIKTLSRNSPRGSYARDAHDLLEKHFKEKDFACAKGEIYKGTGYSFMNAWKILKEGKEPLTVNPFYQSLYSAVQGKEVTGALKIIAKEEDPERRKHAVNVLEQALKKSAIKPDVKKEIRGTLTEIKKKRGSE